MKQQQSGFTLVEIAIVLVIIGLLLGGILKGQELITNARVRNVADQQSSVKAAIYAFQDRFRALPGDYALAQARANVPNSTNANGNGNGVIELNESPLAWHQLAAAGFLSCGQCAADIGTVAPAAGNSPTNAYNGLLVLVTDFNYNDPTPTPPPPARNILRSGSQIPPNVIAEVDRKIDDGNPQTGSTRSTDQSIAAAEPAVAATCVTGGTQWNATDTGLSCAAASFF